jgi:hypothetical protein
MFIWLSWLEIVPFTLGATDVDSQIARETNGVCTGHIAFRAYCRTRWLASFRDWWWVMIVLGYITTSHVDSVERWRDHKSETWYPEQIIHVHDHMESHGLHVIDKLPNDTKINSDYFVIKILSLLEQTFFLEEGRRIRKDLWFMSTIVLFTQVRLRHLGSKSMPYTTCHIYLIRMI